MTAQHTPGPWKLGPTYEASSGGEFICVDANDHGELATVVWRMEDDVESPKCQANARLIAAAPELLEALQVFLNWSDSVYYGEDTSRELASAKDKARAAIEKATKGEKR